MPRPKQLLLSSASTIALAVLTNGVAVGAAHALTYCSETTSGTTANFNLNGTTCTVPILPGSAANITNNPATAGAAGTLYQDASVFSYVGSTTAATPTGTITDGTAQTSVVINFPGYTLTDNIQSSYTGTTSILGGTLIEGAANLASPNSVTTISGGVLDFGGYAQTINNVQLAGGTLQNGALTGAITSSGGAINNITGATSLTTTAGTTTLGGANSAARVAANGGTLAVSTGATLTSTNPLTIASGATLTNAGTISFASGTSVNSGTISNTGNATFGNLTNNGTLAVSNISGGVLSVNGALVNNGTFSTAPTGINATSFLVSGGVTNNGTFNSNFTSSVSGTGTGSPVTNNGTWNGNLKANVNTTTNTSTGTWNGDMTVSSAGTVVNNGTWTSTSAGFSNAGTLTTTGTLNATNGGLTNSGTLNASGTIMGTVTNTGAFTLTGPLSGLTTFSQQVGTLNLSSYTLSTTGPVSLAGGTIENGTIVGPGNTINAIVSSGGTVSNVTNTALVAVSGTTAVQGGGFPALYTSQGASVTATGGLNFSGGVGVGGVGTINGNVSLANGATIAPGTFMASPGSQGYTVSQTGPGTLTLNGNLTLGNGSTLQVAATPAAASQLAVSGLTTISGAGVNVNSLAGTFAPSTAYKILLSTGGVTGTFSTVQNNLAYLTPSLSYDANDAYLTLASNGQSIQSVLTTPNTTAVGAAINSAPNSAIYRAFTTLTVQQAQNAANSLSGEGNTQTQTAGSAATRTFTNFISDRATPGGGSSPAAVEVSVGAPAGVRSYAALAELEANTSPIVVDRPKPPQGMRIFATGFGGASALEGQTSGVAGQTASYYGGLIGVDYKIPNTNLLIGAAVGGSDTDFTVGARSSSGSVTGFNGNVFSIATFGSFYGQSLTTLSAFSNSTTRNIAGFGTGAVALPSAIEKASYGSFEVRERLEVGRVFDVSEKTKVTGFKVTPFAAMEIAELTTQGYSEYNPGGGSNVFGLSATGHTFDDARTFLGVRTEVSYGLANGMTLRPIVRLAWVHAFTTSPTSSNTFQSIPGATFVVAGATVAHNAAETKIGAELDIRKNTVVFANFDGEFGDTEQIYGGRAGIRYSF